MLMRPLAAAVVAALLAPLVYGVAPVFGGLLVFVAITGFGWAAAVAIGERGKERDAYDLGELRKVHEREERRAAEPEGALPDGDWIVCPRCYEEFDARLKVCPRCGGA